MVFSFSVFAQSAQFLVDNYSPKDILAAGYSGSSQYFGIAQDLTGRIYAANQLGVAFFDGKSWVHIDKTEPKHKFFKLASDMHGNVYTGGVQELGVFGANAQGAISFRSLKEHLPDSFQNFTRITRVLSGGERVFFMDYDYLFAWNGIEFSCWTSPARNRKAYIAEGELFLNTKAGLFTLNNEQLELVSKDSAYINLDVRGVIKRRIKNGIEDGYIVVTYSDGLYHLKNGEYQKIPSVLDTIAVYNADVLDDETILFATNGNGLVVTNMEGELKGIVDQSSGLQNPVAVIPFVDQNGAVWLPLFNGVSRVNVSDPVQVINEESGLNAIPLHVYEDDNSFLIGTAGGLYHLRRSPIINQPVSEIFLTNNDAQTHLISKHNGELLVVTASGLFSVNNRLEATLLYALPVITAAEHSMADSNIVYLGNADGLVQSVKYKEGNWELQGEVKLSSTPYYLKESTGGYLWGGFYDLFRINVEPGITTESEVEHIDSTFGYSEAFGPVEITTIDDEIVIGTEMGGYLFNTESKMLERLDALSDPLKDNSTYFAYNLTKSKTGDVWVSSRVGTGRLVPNGDGSYTFDYRGMLHRRQSDIFNIYEDEQGFVWICGAEELIIFDPDKEKRIDSPYQTLIRNVIVDSTIFHGFYCDEDGNASITQPDAYKFALPYSENQIKFAYTAAYYESADELEYSYILEGQDEQWSEWSDEVVKEYTNLWEGDYTFKVRARNVFGTIGETAEYSFTILSPWYRTWWAYILYGIGTVFFFLGLRPIYTRRLIKQKEKLEETIQERTHEIREQKEEIEQQAGQLKTANNELVRLGSFKENLTSMIVHDLKNPLNAILNTDLESGGKRQADAVKNSGNQMLRMVMNILDVQKFEDAKMDLRREEISVNDLIRDAMAQVAFLAKQKEVRLVQQQAQDWTLNADKELMARVLVNLLTNAIKYTPINGVVEVKAAANEAGELLVHVKDNGVGIAESELGGIFTKFTQVDAKKSGAIQSTGLGLTFCKMAVEAHGGEIGVESAPGEGSRFWFTLPALVGEARAFDQTEQPVDTVTGQAMVFSAEDQQYLLPFATQIAALPMYKVSAIRTLLREIDIQKSTAVNAWRIEMESALARVDQTYFDQLLEQITKEGSGLA